MTLKQQAFIEFYVGEARGNASRAADLCGYAAPMQEGYRLKKLPTVWAAIELKLHERTLASHEVLERLTQHAQGSLASFIRQEGESVRLDLTTPQAVADLHLLKKIKTKRKTGGRDDDRWEEIETEIELHDPQAALVQLGRYHKLFTDRHELSTDAEKPIVVKILRGISMDDL